MSDPKIQVSNLSKTIRGKVILKDVDFSVDHGESFVIIGRSGTGKSVLLKNILGLMYPDKGSSIKIDGEEMTELSEPNRMKWMDKIGMLFQGGALFDSLPIWENITFGLIQTKKIRRKDGRDLAVEKLKRVGLEPDIIDLSPAELSGGMQKRVALARAIAGNPEIIFFDEPTTGLDPILADVINHLIVECAKDLGATTLTITHDMSSVKTIADRVALLNEGHILWSGDVDDMEDSGDEYVDQFIHGKSVGPITVRTH